MYVDTVINFVKIYHIHTHITYRMSDHIVFSDLSPGETKKYTSKTETYIKSDLPTLKNLKSYFYIPKFVLSTQKLYFSELRSLNTFWTFIHYFMHIVHTWYGTKGRMQNSWWFWSVRSGFSNQKVRKTNSQQQLFFAPMIAFEWCQFIRTSKALQMHTALTKSHRSQQNIKMYQPTYFRYNIVHWVLQRYKLIISQWNCSIYSLH